jgi:polysaccharide export outer membrane protein
MTTVAALQPRLKIAALATRLTALLGLAAFALLPACAFLPTSGPSKGEVQAVVNTGIQVVDIDDAVARHLLEGRARKLFSEQFRPAAGLAEIIRSGDVLEVSIWEAPPALLFSPGAALGTVAAGGSNSVTLPPQMVSGEGVIYVPFAGKIAATGKTIPDIEADITQRLKGKANQPQVLVRIVTNNTAYVTVVGEVAQSVRMPLTPRGEHLLDALAAAGGTKQPVEKIMIQLTRGPNVYSLPLDTVIRDPRQNIALEPGDVVTALYQPLSFTALGATGKSDEVNFEARGISLAQALARAGGLLDNRSNAEGVFIFRFESKDALKWSDKVTTTPDGKVPVVYRLDLRDPRSFFVAQNFPIDNKDVLYIANAPAAQLQKFINLLISTIYPIKAAVDLGRM